MLFIGITGGVGAGKSEILHYLETAYNCRVMLSDLIAHDLMMPGTDCYRQLRKVFPEEGLYLEDGTFDRQELAGVLFQNPERRETLNGIVHPAVKKYITEQEKAEREAGKIDVLILEAALLIEEHYDAICDELWYIYTSEENRAARLKASRGYSDEKIQNIFAAQLSEEEYRKHCREEIDNNGTTQESFDQIDRFMEARGIRKSDLQEAVRKL